MNAKHKILQLALLFFAMGAARAAHTKDEAMAQKAYNSGIENALQILSEFEKDLSKLAKNNGTQLKNESGPTTAEDVLRPCTCGVFLSDQVSNKKLLTDVPALSQELEKQFMCTKMGLRQCQNECFQVMIKYLPKSSEILCGLIDKDIHKLKAHLFVQNCDTTWHNSNLAAGREYCCKDGAPYACPLFK